MTTVAIFIYSDLEGIMDNLSKVCKGLFVDLVPMHMTYSVYNLLDVYDTDAILDEECPDIIIACGREACTCLEHDGVDGFIAAPDITGPATRKQIMRARAKVLAQGEKNG